MEEVYPEKSPPHFKQIIMKDRKQYHYELIPVVNGDQINLRQAMHILNKALERDMYVEEFQGVLVDSAIIHQEGKRLLKGGENTKYILLKENYLTHSSSNIVIQFTDSDEEAEELRGRYGQN